MSSSVLEDSSNVDASGNFSIQVLSQALQNVFGLALEDSRRPENRSLMQSPDAQTGFVLNRHSHWYCLRKLNNQWCGHAPRRRRCVGGVSSQLCL